jgi:hypothetical protein
MWPYTKSFVISVSWKLVVQHEQVLTWKHLGLRIVYASSATFQDDPALEHGRDSMLFALSVHARREPLRAARWMGCVTIPCARGSLPKGPAGPR